MIFAQLQSFHTKFQNIEKKDNGGYDEENDDDGNVNTYSDSCGLILLDVGFVSQSHGVDGGNTFR